MRHSFIVIIGLVLVAAACGPATVSQQEPANQTASTGTPTSTADPVSGTTVTTTTVPATTPRSTIPATTTTAPGGTVAVSHPTGAPGWIEEEWLMPDEADPWAVAWGEPGMVVLGYHVGERPVPLGLWFSEDGSGWTETRVQDVAIANEYDFTPEVTDLVWFGDRYLAFLMGDTTTSLGRASMLVSGDGVHWDVEYLGLDASATALPLGLYGTPESPPWPGTSAVARIAVHDGELTAVGWTVLSTDEGSISLPVVWRSVDGHSWSTTAIPNADFDREWASDVAVGPLGYLVEVSGPIHQSAWMWFSADGVDWTYIGDRFDDQWRMLTSIAVGENAMLALMMDLETEDQPLSMWRSVDGSRWEQVDSPFVDAEYERGWYLADIASDRYGLIAVAGDNGQTSIWRSADGLDWVELPPVVLPTGEPLIRVSPLMHDATIVGDELVLVAALPGKLFRWTEVVTMSVVGVSADDVLNVRSGAGVANEIVATLSPTATEVVLTGEAAQIGSATWVEIVIDGGVGWVNLHYLGP